MAKSTEPPSSPPQVEHHHEHDHHHHHSHYDRSVHEDGTIVEKTVVEDIVEDKPAEKKGKKKKVTAKANVVAEAQAEVIERTVTETVKETTVVPPASQVFSIRPESVVPPTIAASIAPASAKAPTTVKAKTIKAPTIKPLTTVASPPTIAVPTIIEPAVVPGSPALSHHHPEIIVNFNVPAVPVPPPAKVPSLPPSPAPSIKSMKLPRIIKPATSVGLVEAVTEVDEDEDEQVLDVGDEVVTKVVTTTTTTRRAATPTPPRGPSPAEEKYDPFIPIIENDPTYKPPPPPPPKSFLPPQPLTMPPPTHIPDSVPHKTIETTTVETISYPIDPQGTSADSAASTMGNTTTQGVGRAKSALELVTGGRKSGTKGGLKPIPMGKFRT